MPLSGVPRFRNLSVLAYPRILLTGGLGFVKSGRDLIDGVRLGKNPLIRGSIQDRARIGLARLGSILDRFSYRSRAMYLT